MLRSERAPQRLHCIREPRQAMLAKDGKQSVSGHRRLPELGALLAERAQNGAGLDPVQTHEQVVRMDGLDPVRPEHMLGEVIIRQSQMGTAWRMFASSTATTGTSTTQS